LGTTATKKNASRSKIRAEENTDRSKLQVKQNPRKRIMQEKKLTSGHESRLNPGLKTSLVAFSDLVGPLDIATCSLPKAR
jgi:hypothetical protein